MKVYVVGPNGERPGGISTYIQEQLEYLPGTVETKQYDTSTSVETPKMFFSMLYKFLRVYLNFVMSDPPELVHVHTSHSFSFYKTSLYILFTRFIWRRPVVIHIHGSSFDKFLSDGGWILGFYQSFIINACQTIIVLSDYWRDVFKEEIGHGNVVVLPNSVNPELYEPRKNKYFQVCFISNLIDRKGVGEFIEAIELILEGDSTSPQIAIGGIGPRRQDVENLAEKSAKISYHGYLSEKEKRELLCRSSVYVLPSRAEGLPISILEAMAAGNAIISTSVGSIPEVIDDNSGILIEPGNINDLRDAILGLQNDEERVMEMGEKNREEVIGFYSWNNTIPRLMQIYSQCVNR